MNKQQNSQILPNDFIGRSPDEILTDPYTIANKLNEYFVNVGTGIANKIPNWKR